MNIEFLKRKSQEFFEEVEVLLKRKKYNLSAFNLEQAIQLWIKYLIGKKIGDWAKTHYLSELVFQLSQAYEKEEILKFFKDNELFFDSLEDAYFTSRCFPKEFTENIVLKLLEKSKEFLKLIKEIIGEDFYEKEFS